MMMAVLIPINIWVGKRNMIIQKELLKHRDARMRSLNEVSTIPHYFPSLINESDA